MTDPPTDQPTDQPRAIRRKPNLWVEYEPPDWWAVLGSGPLLSTMKPVSDWPTAYQQPITGHGWPWQGPRRSDWSAGQSQPIRSRALLLECSDCLGGTLGREKPIRNRLWNNFSTWDRPSSPDSIGKEKTRLFLIHFLSSRPYFIRPANRIPAKRQKKRRLTRILASRLPSRMRLEPKTISLLFCFFLLAFAF